MIRHFAFHLDDALQYSTATGQNGKGATLADRAPAEALVIITTTTETNLILYSLF